MSYILDALKRAKAERDRGAAPSIHMPPPPPAVDEDDEAAPGPARATGGSPATRWVVIGLAAALALSLGWQFFGGGGGAAPPERQAQAPQDGGPPHGMVPGGPVPLGSPPGPRPGPQPGTTGTPGDGAQQPLAPAPLPSPAPQMQPPPRPPQPVQQPAPHAAQQAAQQTVPAAPAQPSPSQQPAAAAPAAATPAAPPSTPAGAAQELPEDLRRSLAIGGSRYSDNPSSRILFINGQVFREGDQPTPGVTIERIGLKSATLSARGQRYELKY